MCATRVEFAELINSFSVGKYIFQIKEKTHLRSETDDRWAFSYYYYIGIRVFHMQILPLFNMVLEYYAKSYSTALQEQKCKNCWGEYRFPN